MNTKPSITKRTQDELAQIIIDNLDKNVVPWRSSTIMTTSFCIRNFITKKEYSMLNSMICAIHLINHNQTHPFFLSFKQAMDLNLRVKKGAKSCPIYYFTQLDKKDKDGNVVLNKKGEPEKVPMLRSYRVFNIEDTDADLSGLPTTDSLIEQRRAQMTTEDLSLIDKTNKIVEQWGSFFGGKIMRVKASIVPYYSDRDDSVHVPVPELFNDSADYCATVFHELIHSTGIESRLNRKCFEKYGENVRYRATEELVAEMGASLVCGWADIPLSKIGDEEQWASYCHNWAQNLRDNPQIIWAAATSAKKASDYLVKDFTL